VLNLSFPDRDRRWSLSNVVFATYIIFLAGFYFVPNAVDNYKFYIAAVFLPGLFLLRETFKRSLHSPIWLSLLAFIGYSLLSSLWSDEFSAAALWRDVRYCAYVLVFILLTVHWFERNRQLPDAIMNVIALVVIVASVVSVILFEDLALLPVLTENRMIGLGITDNPNPSAFIYGFFGVIALDYARRNWGEKLAWVYAAGLAVIVLFVVLTQSNTGLLALASACALLFLLDRRPAPPALIAGLSIGLAAGIYLFWSLGLLSAATDLGFMARFPIWERIIERWQDAPLFGYGYQPTIVLLPDGKPSILNYAHSSFLAALRDGGIVGLVLLLLVYCFALRAGLKMVFTVRRARYLSLFAFGVICVLVDTDQLVTRPRELWIILWLPLACLVAYELGLTGEDSSGSVGRQAGSSPNSIR
jgi:O-antigen ligase